MENYSEIHSFVDKNKEKIIDTIKQAVRIPSVRGEAQKNAPYGEECKNMLCFCEQLFKENGFETAIDYDGGYLLSSFNRGEKTIGLFAHSDVVAAGDNWTYTNPFEPIEKDGFLIGRGVSDDKTAIVLSAYAMKIIKELNLPLKSRILTFVGSVEETGMYDIDNYLKKNTPPDFSLVPDSKFPTLRGAKGRILLSAECKNRLCDITDFGGGKAENVILADCSAKIKYSDSLYKEIKEKCPENITATAENGSIVLSAKGISRHAALPDGSLNAGYLIADFLSNCMSLNQNDRKIMKTVSVWLDDKYGEALGIAATDNDFGKLTCANGKIRTENGKISLSLDIRHGISIDKEKTVEKIKKTLEENGFCYTLLSNIPSYCVDKNDKAVKMLVDTYREFTGDSNAESSFDAGATYACKLPYALEIGPSVGSHAVPFTVEKGHGGCHQPDEYISIDGLLKALELTVIVLLRIDKMLNGE